ncbi:MAG: tetratricopeptide repeat protein, partial [Candidatus Omnitrophica bacterium]|nr:tetratricopeptide repeat protein [Candidatus Omnitrophota bacterium]
MHLTFEERLFRIFAMKYLKIYIVVILLCFLSSSAFAFWIWTPETGKWINPKNYVRDTPEEQFNLGYKQYQDGDFKQAIESFRKLARYYDKSKYAPEAQFYIGQAYERLGKYYNAFTAYQKIIDSYPYTARVDEVIALEYKIGNLYFVRNNADRVLSERMSFLDDNMRAIEIFKKVIENSPYGEYAPTAQYKLGLVYKRIGDYPNAEEAFKNLITGYPTSKLVSDAIVQLAQVASKRESKVAYSQEGTEVAIQRLKELSSYGDMPEEGEEILARLQERKAESLYETAKFYEKQKKYSSAVVYYEEIVKSYPNTNWAV